jgi:hypothetical protein
MARTKFALILLTQQSNRDIGVAELSPYMSFVGFRQWLSLKLLELESPIPQIEPEGPRLRKTSTPFLVRGDRLEFPRLDSISQWQETSKRLRSLLGNNRRGKGVTDATHQRHNRTLLPSCAYLRAGPTGPSNTMLQIIWCINMCPVLVHIFLTWLWCLHKSTPNIVSYMGVGMRREGSSTSNTKGGMVT